MDFWVGFLIKVGISARTGRAVGQRRLVRQAVSLLRSTLGQFAFDFKPLHGWLPIQGGLQRELSIPGDLHGGASLPSDLHGGLRNLAFHAGC